MAIITLIACIQWTRAGNLSTLVQKFGWLYLGWSRIWLRGCSIVPTIPLSQLLLLGHSIAAELVSNFKI